MTHAPGKTRRHAFTIIELVVAMAIASIMIFLINRIFFDTTNAISRGVGLSQIIGEARAASATMEEDFSSNTIAVPPADPGFIFIGFKTFTNVNFPSSRRLGSTHTRNVQSDQLLVFVKNIGNRHSLTPRDAQGFAPYPITADQGVLWYGHVSRLDPDGSKAGTLNENTNIWGHNWIVGRQLTFLDTTILTATPAPFLCMGLTANSLVLGAPTIISRRYMAGTDIVSATANPLVAGGSLVTAPNDDQYIGHAASMAYLTVDGSSGSHRLQVATNVDPANGFASWNVAQTHPAFLNNCSDFHVSFAGNFDATPGIDVDSSGSIKWYGYPVNDPLVTGYDPDKPPLYEPVFTPSPTAPIVRDAANLLTNINATSPVTPIVAVEVDHAVVFRHDTASPETEWPHLIRIRYRLHDERGEIESTTGEARTQGIWFEQVIRIPIP